LKDWQKAGYRIIQKDPLPDYDYKFIDVKELSNLLSKAGEADCLDKSKRPDVTLLDYRTKKGKTSSANVIIQTSCPIISLRLDDLRSPEVRKQIPKTGLVVLLSETGSRDPIAMKYMSKHGYKNLVGLRFGMRAWIKAGLPIH
jgi:rhodanese-related sulfurtransferase